ncbi:DUF3558 family protein [Saccharopolyspora thermophila]|uniref:DUF3558 family protein n=1 Tax=Saccharopolyspora thermophila TaxID=89367 RepID=UPI001E592DBF|nr:DUF3558 family protein [Saccharopolyspora subtropica]
MRRQAGLSAIALVGVVAGCTAGESGPPTVPPAAQTSTTEEVTSSAAAPSLTRTVSPEQRRRLADLTPEQVCGLVDVGDLSALAFPVDSGHPREVGFAVRGCSFQARSGERSVVIGAQPEGYGTLGREEVDLGPVRGSQTLHASDCTVFVPVAGATLQVSVTAGETSAEQCQTAQHVAQYVLAAVVQS